jgi:hypothetical protein
MPMVFPSRVVRAGIALTTAARHLEDPGGKQNLYELIQGTDVDTMAATAIFLARVVGSYCSDEVLQDVGLQTAGDRMVVL